ncbi:hypothetical protein NDU88_003933 [Pleurodeles waltl]|uniref:Secreted protein n=1 Tax=Pleurodeles waltl TaxID=8319 RepID=A0AAV7QBG8_PLEWA|nr:hypothetical protein NDU88_003933 [Pleurodeles waltl]
MPVRNAVTGSRCTDCQRAGALICVLALQPFPLMAREEEGERKREREYVLRLGMETRNGSSLRHTQKAGREKCQSWNSSGRKRSGLRSTGRAGSETRFWKSRYCSGPDWDALPRACLPQYCDSSTRCVSERSTQTELALSLGAGTAKRVTRQASGALAELCKPFLICVNVRAELLRGSCVQVS